MRSCKDLQCQRSPFRVLLRCWAAFATMQGLKMTMQWLKFVLQRLNTSLQGLKVTLQRLNASLQGRIVFLQSLNVTNTTFWREGIRRIIFVGLVPTIFRFKLRLPSHADSTWRSKANDVCF